MTTPRRSTRIAAASQDASFVSNIVPTTPHEPKAVAVAAAVTPNPAPAATPEPGTQPTTPQPLAHDVPDMIPYMSLKSEAYKNAIRKAHSIVYGLLPQGNVRVTGSAALWLADKDATWYPEDIDIPVRNIDFFDLVGRLVMSNYKRGKTDASGYCFEIPLKYDDTNITVQIYPVENILDSIKQHDLEAVRCWAEPAGILSMRVSWCPGVDVNKILKEHRTDYYHIGKGCKQQSPVCTELGRDRAAKYTARGFTVESKEGISECPYCARGSSENSWRLSSVPETRRVAIVKCPINGLTMMDAGYEPPYLNRAALWWLEQQWVDNGCNLTKEQLLAYLPKAQPCPVNVDVLIENMFPPIARGRGLLTAQRNWHESGCSASKAELVHAAILATKKFHTQEVLANVGSEWVEREEAKIDLNTHTAKTLTNRQMSTTVVASSAAAEIDDNVSELESVMDSEDKQEEGVVMVNVSDSEDDDTSSDDDNVKILAKDSETCTIA
jgi:hypothetical protein